MKIIGINQRKIIGLLRKCSYVR